jgi:molybdate transport system regulatory protein
MDISYRRAWDKIHESEERLGVKLVDTQTGGVGGGGSRLTPEATDYIDRFCQFTSGLNDLIAQRFREYFNDD